MEERDMMPSRNSSSGLRIAVAALLGALCASGAQAEVPGISGPSFALTAKSDRISTPEGGSFLIWGFASGGGRAQYPGPTLIVEEGAAVAVSVQNALPAAAGQRVSLSFPGQTGVTAECTAGPCVQGPIAMEAGQGGTVTYRFTASRPGTFLYNSATRPDLQIEMGLFGALIVRPAGFAGMSPPQAYGTPESSYDQEYMFLLSEMDSTIHDLVEQSGPNSAGVAARLANYFSNYWFINGRNAPDTMAEPGAVLLPTQPYNSLPRVHPGDRMLMRVIGGGRDLHPFHHHGNHARIIAVDGFLKQSAPGDALDLSHEVFTIQSLPGQTVDAIFTWTGKDLGWDIYGDNPVPGLAAQPAPAYAHTCTPAADGFDVTSREYCADHMKPIPVTQPEDLSLAFGGFWAGSYLGTMAQLPPGEGGLNPTAGFTYMWHSHTEKEIVNFDVFPGGMMTMLIVEPMNVPIN
jgi:FtsP/CotA-like multicopper oxidase with cupredoxin domain